MVWGARPVAGDSVVEVRLLGPVQAARAGRDLALGGPRQRAVLALLLADAGQVVPAGRLAEEVWRGCPPPGAARTLRSYVSRLRAVLAPEVTLAWRGGGYVLGADAVVVDAARFERLVAAGQGALGGGDLGSAAARLGEALALWRGPALAGVGDVDRLAREAARLEELRLVAVEGRIEADIGLGRPGEVIGELETLVAEHPLRENVWRLLVLALYRAQRQADALAAYRRARELLAEELGLEPGEELRALEQAVLRQEVPPVPPSARHNLPAPLTSLVGREQELADLDRLLDQARLVTLTGTGGVGKTRLAVELAGGVLARFADGAWLAVLAGVGDPGLVSAAVMQALGVRPEAGVAAAEALAYRLRSAELLLVVDNCEHLLDACAGLIRELLGRSPGLRVLATSREALGLPGEIAYVVRPLPVEPAVAGSGTVALAPAVRLLLDRGAAARGAADGVVAPVAVAERICRALDGLPLAIELAAARLGTLSAADVEAQLADRFTFLAARRPAGDPRHQALQAAMDWSYDLLTAAEREAFEQLSVFAGSFGLAQVAEVCTGGDRAAAVEVTGALAGKSLVTAELGDDVTRYRLLETVRQYAAARLAKAGDPEAARRRHAVAYLRLAGREGDPAVLAADLDNFRAALDWALSAGDETGPRLAAALGDFWLARGLLHEGRGWVERALAQHPADQRLRAALLRHQGALLYEDGDLQHAEAVLAEAAGAADAAGDPVLRARIEVLLAGTRITLGGSMAAALGQIQAARAVLDAAGDLAGLAEAWFFTGRAMDDSSGDWAAEEKAFEQALGYARQSGHRHVAARASVYIGILLSNAPVRADRTIARLEQLLHDAGDDPWAEAHLLGELSGMYGYVARFADARVALARSRALLTRFGARYYLVLTTFLAGLIEETAGDFPAAERWFREGYEALRAMADRAFLSFAASGLAEALYAQGRFQEAQQMSEQAEATADPGDFDPQARWKIIRVKLLAQRGQFPAARRLLGEVQAALPPGTWPLVEASTLAAKAEIARLAGTPEEAEHHLRAALRIYQDFNLVGFAERTKAAIASLPQT